MASIIRKTLVGGLVALTAVATLAATPAQAKPWAKGFHGHGGFGGWGAAAVFGGLALGALAVSAAPAYECGMVRVALVNDYGVIIGYRYVPAC